MLHVCSLIHLPGTVQATGASHVITVMADVEQVRRPPTILADNHLVISMDDITEEAEGFVAPSLAHVERVLAFGQSWNRSAPMVIHCYAGISRSTAGAFITACALNPKRDEASIAQAIRSFSPTAQPNIRLVTLADALLGRRGRMTHAIREIGPGLAAYEGHPFRLDLE